MDTDQTPRRRLSKTLGSRWFGVIAAAVGFGTALMYLWNSGKRTDSSARARRRFDHKVDDRGTGQEEAAQILRKLRNRAFEASDEKLAMALGRPVEEIVAWDNGLEPIDDDVVMKARGIALHRGVRVE
jgi:hypothetical protein